MAQRKRRDERSNLITGQNGIPSFILESYRTLRTNITLSQVDEKIKSILITSTGPREGKSLTVSNLGATFAMAGNKVLLVDADLRRPTLHRFLSVPKDIGLTDYLVGEADFDTVICPTSMDSLFVIPCGTIPPNPAELLGSKKMRGFVEQCEGLFDYIIYDSPPIASISDASVLASMVSHVILIVRADGIDRNHIARAKEQLETVRAKILGVVLNDVNIEKHRYYYRYYYYYYDYDTDRQPQETESQS